jgi:hypothetical protein
MHSPKHASVQDSQWRQWYLYCILWYCQEVGNYVPSDLDVDPVMRSPACVVVDTAAVVDSVDEPTFTQFVFVVS